MGLFDTCPICKSSIKKIPTNKDGDHVDCPRCGRYFISGSALADLNHSKLNKHQIANLSGWISENYEVTISSNNLADLLSLKSPTVSERAEKLMLAIEKNSKFISDNVAIPYNSNDNKWLSISWSQNSDELSYLIEKYLIQERNWVVDADIYNLSGISVQLTPSGYAYLDMLRKGHGEGVQAFCAMWFNPSITPVWTEAIAPAIEAAGYRPIRIDEVDHNNRIDDEILAQIRRSRFVVADFTGDRGGVYFEAGFALGLGMQVIWTVRDDDLKSVHFDNRQYNFLQWSLKDLPSFKMSLQNRIEATLGLGPIVNNK